MVTCDMSRFQGIYQICANSCIPASIENVVRYHGGNISQREFLDNFLKDYNMKDLHFQKVKEFLDNDPFFTMNFKSEYKIKDDHKDIPGLLKYIEECIARDLPVMIALNDGKNAHVVTVRYIEGGKIAYFDSNPKTGGFSDFIEIKNIQSDFAKGLGTFVIIPK